MFLAVKFLIAELVALLIFPDPSVFCFNVILQAGIDYSDATARQQTPSVCQSTTNAVSQLEITIVELNRISIAHLPSFSFHSTIHTTHPIRPSRLHSVTAGRQAAGRRPTNRAKKLKFKNVQKRLFISRNTSGYFSKDCAHISPVTSFKCMKNVLNLASTSAKCQFVKCLFAYVR